MSATAYIALGSNLGDRRETLDRALQMLQERPGIVVSQVSSYLETAPVGGPPGQGNYLNAAAELRTELTPRELLTELQAIEQALGRVRAEHWGPRTLDLDLLLYDDFINREAGLLVPHPRLHERRFVLEPLNEIAPNALHPILRRNVHTLLEELDRSEGKSAPNPPRELGGQRAVVTGSTSGIGRAIALELAAAGANVVIHGRRSRTAADAVANQVRDLGVDASVSLADLGDAGACEHLVRETWKAGPVTIWVNNAGADTLTGEAAGWPFERKLEALYAIDLRATMLLARAVGARMKEAGRGVILNVGWDQAETGMAGDSGQLFGAIKAAVMAFSKSLALELAPHVRVNCLAPGWIRTAWGENASEPWQQRVLRETPLARWGTPEDVARTARWLASPAASFVTGQVIRVNGGAVR